MTIQRAQMTCAAAIANLEGKHDIELPFDLAANSTLDMLERRTRVLEGRFLLSPPPANLDPTWDSLGYRICRLQHKASIGQIGYIPIYSFTSMVPDDFEVSLQTLKSFCMDLARPRTTSLMRPWPKDADDDELLEYIRQTFCYEVGRERIIMKSVPITPMEIYAQVIGLTVKRDTPVQLSGLPPGWRTPGTMVPPARKKACCGCCNCYCHDSKDSDTNSARSEHKSRFGFGWFTKLAFWRRSKASDAASISTRGTSTIVDA